MEQIFTNTANTECVRSNNLVNSKLLAKPAQTGKSLKSVPFTLNTTVLIVPPVYWYCSRSRRRAEKVDKRMVLVHTHGFFYNLNRV